MFIIAACHLFLTAKSERFLVGSKWVFDGSEKIGACIGYLDAPLDWELCIEQPQGYETASETGSKMMNTLQESFYSLSLMLHACCMFH